MVRKLRAFEYLRPGTVAEAVSLLKNYQEKASLLAGGTDLLVFMKLGQKHPKYVIDMKGVPALDHLSWAPADGLTLGSLITLQSLLKHPLIGEHFPILAEAAKAVGHPQVRSRATVTGNICTASPSGDMAPSLIALEARVKVTGLGGERTVPVKEIFAGPFRTVLAPTDVVTDIFVPALAPRSGGCYRWQPKLTAVDETLVGASAVVSLADGGKAFAEARIGLGSVAPTPIRASKAEAFLKGKQITDSLLAEAAGIAAGESRPRTRAEYRREITKVLVEDALREAVARARRNGGGK